jgi:putative flippase GtrA
MLLMQSGWHFSERPKLPEWAIWTFATELAIVSNFILNNIWTFKAEKITGAGMLVKKFLQFNGTSVGALLIQAVFGSL